MAERQKYEKWLKDLDAKRSSTPPKVFERVHGDYSERLQEVLDGLRQHTTELQEHARGLMVRLKELEVAEEELREEQEENGLRAQVGELSEDDYESGKKKADKVLAKFKEDQEQVADDLNQIRQILAGAAGQSTDTPPQGMPRTSTDFDELAFLKSVVGQPAPQANSSPRPGMPSNDRPSQPKPAVSDAKPPAERPSGERPKPEPLVETPKPAEPLTGKAGTTGSNPKVQHDSPSVIRTSAVGEQQKTLKCAECGSMNYPAEWYCERCGAELANI